MATTRAPLCLAALLLAALAFLLWASLPQGAADSLDFPHAAKHPESMWLARHGEFEACYQNGERQLFLEFDINSDGCPEEFGGVILAGGVLLTAFIAGVRYWMREVMGGGYERV